MRIAVIVNQFPKLSETFILDQITGLLDRGHEVDIFAWQMNKDGGVIHPDIKKYRLLERTHVLLSLRTGGIKKSGLVTIFKDHSDDLKILIRSLNIFKYGKSALSLKLINNVLPFLEGYDIIHCHFGSNGNYAATLKKLGVSGKLVTTFHGCDTRRGIKQGGGIYKKLFEVGDLFVAVTEYNYDHLIQFGADKTKIVSHPLGIDISKFYFDKSRYAVTPETIRLVTTGRLVGLKGHHYAIRAFKKVLEKNQNLKIRYDFIGDGPLKEELTSLIKELNLQNVVFLLGALTKEQIVETLQQSHIFVLPSVTETFGMVLLEAQAVGLPVIVSRVGSTNQAIVDGKSGYLVPVGDVDGLAQKIAHLVANPELWVEMGSAGRKHVEKNYDIDKLNDGLVEIYRNLLES